MLAAGWTRSAAVYDIPGCRVEYFRSLGGGNLDRATRRHTSIRKVQFFGVLVVLVFAAGACSSSGAAAPEERIVSSEPPVVSQTTVTTEAIETSASIPDPIATFSGTAVVIDRGEQPVVCSGAIGLSDPPVCDGMPLDGLNWSSVPWAHEKLGVRWAALEIVVRLEGDRLELVGAPGEPQFPEPISRNRIPPCPAPEGGWSFKDTPMATEQHLRDAAEYIDAQPDSSGSWAYDMSGASSEDEGRFAVVLIATFTGDLARHEAAIRELWDGPLCLAHRPWAEQDLRRIQSELVEALQTDGPSGIVRASGFEVDARIGVVIVDTVIGTPDGQAWLDARYGSGVVRLRAVLEPTD